MKFNPMIVALLVLLAAATANSQPYAYIANSGTRNISVVDTADDTITATIPLPDTLPNVHPYAYGITVGPSGQYVYVGLQDTNEVTVIDTARNAVVKRISMGGYSPAGLAVDASESRLYVAAKQSNLLLIYDITGIGAELVSAVAVSDQVSSLEGVVLSPAGDRAYVANSLADSVAVVSLEDANVESVIELGSGFRPMALAISADGDKLYAAGLYGGFVKLDMSLSPVGKSFQSIPGGVLSLAISSDGSRVYAPSNTLDILSGITTDPLAVSWYPLAAGPRGISVTPDGSKLYVTMNTATYGNSVKVFDTGSNTVTKTIPLPADSRPTSIGNFIGPVFPYTITTIQGPNCTIVPSGVIAVNSLGRRFDVAATSGQCEVAVDGAYVGMPSAYAFSNVAGNHTIDVRQASPGSYCTLTVDPTGLPNRYLVSSPFGIGLQSYSAKFLCGTLVSLQANPGSVASGWGGACSGTGGSICSLLMDSDKHAFATVSYNPPICPVKIGQSCYASIDEAINAASSGDLIRVSATYVGGGISTGGGPTGVVTVSGGWDNTFFEQSGFASLSPSTFRARCAIVLENLSF